MRRTEPPKPLNKMSSKAQKELKIWLAIKNLRIILLQRKLGYLPCEYCGNKIINGSELYRPEGHHNNHNRRDNTLDNCRILHRMCNQVIEDKNIKDVPSML